MKYDDFGERMKQYEKLADFKLKTKIPVAIRLDGRAFHTWTKGLNKPFDELFVSAMQLTLLSMCENVEGCVFGYTQSDEITLVLVDYQRPETSAWFNYRIQKMSSVAASMATKYFGQHFTQLALQYYEDKLFENCENNDTPSIFFSNSEIFEELAEELELDEDDVKIVNDDYATLLMEKIDNLPCFDARCFNVPIEEVTNAIYWRQSDAIRNSIQACGQAMFSHKELQHKSCGDIQIMLAEKGEPWEDLPTYLQRGTACRRVTRTTVTKTEEGLPHIIINNAWELDFDMPTLLGENRNYVEDLITFKEEN